MDVPGILDPSSDDDDAIIDQLEELVNKIMSLHSKRYGTQQT